jgi:hypothetical protein
MASGAWTSCNWRQRDTTVFTLTADNTFTAAITETQDQFANACGMVGKPTSGVCTSSWTWMMKIHVPALTPDVLTGRCD